MLCLLAIVSRVQASGVALQQCSFPDPEAATQRFSKAIQFETISGRAKTGGEEFRGLIEWLSQAYADVWDRLQVEQVLAADSMSHLDCLEIYEAVVRHMRLPSGMPEIECLQQYRPPLTPTWQ